MAAVIESLKISRNIIRLLSVPFMLLAIHALYLNWWELRQFFMLAPEQLYFHKASRNLFLLIAPLGIYLFSEGRKAGWAFMLYQGLSELISWAVYVEHQARIVKPELSIADVLLDISWLNLLIIALGGLTLYIQHRPWALKHFRLKVRSILWIWCFSLVFMVIKTFPMQLYWDLTLPLWILAAIVVARVLRKRRLKAEKASQSG